MATAKWATPESIQTALSTGLDSLGDGSYSSASSAIDNETGKYLYVNVEIYLASLTPATDGEVLLYLLYSLDGTNFEDGGGATAPNNAALVAVRRLSTATATKRHMVMNIPLAPFQFKVVLKNDAGVALASSGNTVKYRRHNGDVS